MKCIFVNDLKKPPHFPDSFKNKKGLFFPEKKLSILEQSNFDTKKYSSQYDFIVTNNPFILTVFWKEDVLIFKNNNFLIPEFQTYGMSFEVALKRFNGLGSTISNIVVTNIREKIKEGDNEAFKFVEKLGYSSEKAYLLRKLKN